MTLFLKILISLILILTLLYATFKMNYLSYRLIKQILAIINMKKVLKENTIINKCIVIGKVLKRRCRSSYSPTTRRFSKLYYTKLEIYDSSNEKSHITLDSDKCDIYSTFTSIENNYEFIKTEYSHNNKSYIVYNSNYNDTIKDYIFINKPYNEIIKISKSELLIYIFVACFSFPITLILNVFSIYTFYYIFESFFSLI